MKNASKYEAAFTNSLHHLFEIDSADALACMSVEDRPYLLSEKEKARRESQNSQKKEKKVDKQVLQEELPGERCADRRYLASNELEAARKQMKKKKRTHREERQKQKAEAYAKRLSEKIILSGSSSQDSKPSSQGSVFESKLQSPKRKRLQILDEELSSALDRTRTPNRNATFLIAKTAKSMGVDVKTLTVSEASVRRRRAELRKKSAQRIQRNFNPDVPLTIHVDGKLLPPLMGDKKKIDRLPILVTGHNIDQLLSVPALPSGKGIFIAEAICQTVREWNIEEQVKSICFDTTSSNTGVKSGSCVCTERILGKRLLYCACRHHVSELLLDAAVTSHIGKRNQPENPIFTNFRDKWEDIDPSTYTTALDDPDILENVQPIKTELLNFCFEQLSKHKHREDYRELLELVIIFCGATPERGVRFRRPGAVSNARWMAKALYFLKIYMFQKQFTMSKELLGHIKDICTFIVCIYVKYWFQSPSGVMAPKNDCDLLSSLLAYEKINLPISTAALKKSLAPFSRDASNCHVAPIRERSQKRRPNNAFPIFSCIRSGSSGITAINEKNKNKHNMKKEPRKGRAMMTA